MSDMIFYNGDIITMDDSNKSCEAIFVRNGKILKVGSSSEVMNLRTNDTEVIDLKGKTLMPGFIDPHSHVTAYAQTMATASLRDCKSMSDIVNTLKAFKEKKGIKDDWIVGVGYDHNMLVEKRHPNKFDLDVDFGDCPVMISHASGHMGVANSKALELMGIDENTVAATGGIIGRVEGTNEPDGYLEENAFINRTGVMLNQSIEKKEKLFEEAQYDYLRNGITTCQDGFTKKDEWDLLKALADDKKLKIDVVGYVDIADNKNIVAENADYVEKYKDRLKIGGYKLILDGSPQGKTAWMTKPYEGETEYRGYPAKSDELVNSLVKTSVLEGRQLLTHCNGDAASDQLINAFYELEDKEAVKKTRPVMIHAQTVRKDQLEKFNGIGMMPSFFVTHTYYWGDIHIKNLGDRAYRISPVKTAMDVGVKYYTFHQDTPVLLPSMVEMVWSAVNRLTLSGVVLGEDERISVYDALKGITINAAYQYFEEDSKGSITEGKLADLVVLDSNPLKVKKEDIKNIKVLKTYKEGELLFSL